MSRVRSNVAKVDATNLVFFAYILQDACLKYLVSENLEILLYCRPRDLATERHFFTARDKCSDTFCLHTVLGVSALATP